jgi:hypothetical protein
LKLIWRLILMFLRHRAKMMVVAKAKKAGTLAYLRAVQGSRRALMLALAAFLLLQTMLLAGFGALVTGFMIWDTDPAFKWPLLFGIFLGMFALPALALVVLFSERLWYRASGAKKMVDSLGEHQQREAA